MDRVTDTPTVSGLRGFLLCDAVGMGKTISALSLFVKDMLQMGQPRPTIIFCPEGLEESIWIVSIIKPSPTPDSSALRRCDRPCRSMASPLS